MECQIEANPNPSYVWYEILSNITSDYPYTRLSSTGQSVFGTTRQIQRIYQYPGQYAMQCQAQSRGKTVKQDFIISVVCKFIYSDLKIFISFFSSTIKYNEN